MLKREDELIHFIGFLPFQFYKFIGLLERNNYLKSSAYDDMYKLNVKYRQEFKLSDDKENYLDNMLKVWIEENPQFYDLIIFD